MKTLTVATSRLLLPLAILLAGCSGYSSPTGTTSPSITPIIANGNWVVSSMVQGTEDKTAQFAGYTFNFVATGAESGTITAARNGSTVSGTWSHSSAVSYYGSPDTPEALALNLGNSAPFDRLSRTWNVESSSSSSLNLSSAEVTDGSHLILAKQ